MSELDEKMIEALEQMAKMPYPPTDQPTLRDRFAMAALTGIGADAIERGINESVALAYRVADAMLKERAK